MRSSMGVIGYVQRRASNYYANISSDLAEAFPGGQLATYYRQDWLSAMIKDTRSNRDFQARTIDTARWAREQVKRQIGGASGVMQST